ncbi:MAG: CoA transferase [Ktedonobacteraceae bacterium]
MPEMTAPLEGIKVIDIATLFAGPMIGTMLGDFGADVLKIEHPRGDPLRTHGYLKDGVGLWWKVAARNKRCITLSLSQPAGAEIFKHLVAHYDVVVENFRPGTLERWGLGWDILHEINPRLILVRVTGFGQQGPYSNLPGFGTLVEAMTGFAHIMGEPDGPPTLPPFGLADGICAMVGTWATAFALYHRDARGGEGQMIDLALYEPLLTILGAQPTFYDQLGIIQNRMGNRTPNNAPRNLYRTRDDRWAAVSTSGDNIAKRVMNLVGHPEIIEEPWFSSARGRAEHADILDEFVGGWIEQRDLDEVMKAFKEVGAAVAPIYNVSHVMSDPHFKYRESITELPDPDFGTIKMQNILARMSGTPGQIRWTGRSLGADSEEVFRKELGLTPEEITSLRCEGVI